MSLAPWSGDHGPEHVALLGLGVHPVEERLRQLRARLLVLDALVLTVADQVKKVVGKRLHGFHVILPTGGPQSYMIHLYYIRVGRVQPDVAVARPTSFYFPDEEGNKHTKHNGPVRHARIVSASQRSPVPQAREPVPIPGLPSAGTRAAPDS